MNLKLLLMPLLATSVLVAACGGEHADKTDAPVPRPGKGTLTVGTDASYPPIEFMGADGKTVEGLDADLANALGGALGLKAEVKHATFDSILPGLTTQKYDVGMSGFTDTKEREETVDFVTYFSAGTSFFVKAQEGGPVSTRSTTSAAARWRCRRAPRRSTTRPRSRRRAPPPASRRSR